MFRYNGEYWIALTDDEIGQVLARLESDVEFLRERLRVARKGRE